MININIKTTNFNMTPDIEEMIKEKIYLVEKFIDSTEEIPLAEIEVERSAHQKKGEVFRAEINFSYKGNVIRVEHKDFDIRNAIEKVRRQLEKRIRRSKGRRFDLIKAGGRKLKRLIRRKNNE